MFNFIVDKTFFNAATSNHWGTRQVGDYIGPSVIVKRIGSFRCEKGKTVAVYLMKCLCGNYFAISGRQAHRKKYLICSVCKYESGRKKHDSSYIKNSVQSIDEGIRLYKRRFTSQYLLPKQ